MIDIVKDKIGFNHSIDFKEKIFEINNEMVCLIYNHFLADGVKIANLIFSIIKISENQTLNLDYEIGKKLINENIIKSKNIQEISEEILAGSVAIFIENNNEVLLVDVRNYPGREIGEPDSERVVRGSKDGFTENVVTNIALVRRRIKSGHLVSNFYSVGQESKTSVVVMYLDNHYDKKAFEIINKKLKETKISELTMADKALEEIILPRTSLFPLVKYTERPDSFASHLYQGMIGIIVDNSPSAIIAPISLFDNLQHSEDFRQNRIIGSYLRIIRFFAIFASWLIIPVYLLLQQNPGYVLDELKMFFDFDKTLSSQLFQLLIISFGIELIRMASIYTPNALSTSMGLIIGVAIGGMGINIGLLNEKIVFIGIINAIGQFITPSYELSLANKVTQIFILLCTAVFGLSGFIVSFILVFVYLMSLKSINRYYLYPIFPLNLRDLRKQFIRRKYK